MGATSGNASAGGVRFRERALSVLLAAQLVLIFVAEPGSAMGFNLLVAVTLPIMLVLILVVASSSPGALIIAVVAVGARALTGILAIRHAGLTTYAKPAAGNGL